MSARRVLAAGALFALVGVATSGVDARDEQLPGWFDLEVHGGEAALDVLGMRLEERAFTLPMLARSLYDRDQRTTAVDARLAGLQRVLAGYVAAQAEVITIPAPLSADVWRDILRPVKPPATTDLFTRMVADRHALLVAYGLTATSDDVRAWLARDRELLRFIYQQAPGAFAVVARRLEIAGGQIVAPGGADAMSAWEGLAGVSPARADQFLRTLLTKDQGRLAWYYDTIGGLDDAQLRAAWPASLPARERGALLYPAFRDPDPQWRLPEQPFRRNAIDAWMVMSQNRVADGAASSPLPQATWALLFSTPRPNGDQLTRSLEEPRRPVALSWLVRETLSPLVRERRQRYEMFRLAQRAFTDATPDQLPDVAVALTGVRHTRALVLTLERMGLRDPAVWAAAIDAARFVSEQAEDRRESFVIFQSVIALLERMRHVRTIDVVTTERIIRSLSQVVQADRHVAASMQSWIAGFLLRAVPPLTRPDEFTGRTAYESTLLQALAGPPDRHVPTVNWEGLDYVADPVAAEHERLLAIRAQVPTPGLDAALTSSRPRDLAAALTALVYTTALGDPDGPASLSPEVASRHEFGLTATTLLREEMPWSPPEERQGTGPWHVQGSLLGLDLALSRLFLRRIADQQMPQAPTLTLNDLGTLSRTGVGMVARDLSDADRDELAAAIARGRARVHSAATVADLTALAHECRMAAPERQLLTWIASRQRAEVQHVFSLRDLLWLGRPSLSRDVLDRWGVSAEALDGRRIPAMPPPAPWEDYAGRSEVGQVTTQVPDLTLRLVEETARLKLPAALVPSLLAFALEDYWHDVRVRFADDWPRLTRQAAALTAVRIHDYVAALAGGGPLRAQ